MKKCSKCEELLDESLFSPANGGRYLRPECRKCANLLSKRRKILKEKHGEPSDGYKCPICHRTKEELLGTGGKAGVWVTDHSHDTDLFRGHICHQCNRGLGLFQDDISRLKRCIEYLLNQAGE
jgi:hypothetical protein